MKITKVLRTSVLTLGLLGILQNSLYAGTTEQQAFIERFYQNILNRSSDSTGMDTWMNTIQNQSATKVAMGFLNSPELTNKNLSNEEFLDIMYQTMFDRLADSGGRNDWLNKMRNGRTKQSVMFGFFQSQEFKNLTDSFGVTQILPTDRPSLTGVESYVDRFYRLVLKRNYDENGFNDWVKQLTNKTKNPTEIANGFLFSPEYINQNEDNSTFLETCYQAFFGRASDEGGKNDWLNKINNQNYTRQQIFEGFTGSQEFANLVNSFNLDNVDNDAPVITSASTFTVNENQTNGFTITSTDDSTVTYFISGTDSSLFNVNATTGVVTFKTNPDFETKTTYSLTVRAMDSSNNVSSKDVTLNIADVDENISLTTFQSGDTWKGFTYNVVTSPITGRQWLDRNLGATQVCTSSTDTACYGDYYQWGRLADGHEKANSVTTTTLAIDIANVGDKIIVADTYPNDWTTVDNNGELRAAQWSKTDGTGICPVGFRIPTIDELKNETLSYIGTNNISTGAIKVTNSTTAFQNFLKLPTAGYHGSFISNQGSWGTMWSSSVNGITSSSIGFGDNYAPQGGYNRSYALSIRCVRNNSTDSTPPTITSSSTFSTDENQTSAFTITATDNSIVTYSISGTDATSFNVNSTTGAVTFKTAPDYETKTSYSLTVKATDASNNISSKDITININDVVENTNPTITFKGLNYGIVTSPITGKQWLDRNLGASQVCNASNDTACYGDYFQWGRLADGHEKSTSGTTEIRAVDISNTGNSFIKTPSSYPNDWTNIDGNGALRIAQWRKTDETGICPAGFRVPTKIELEYETTGYSGINDITTGAVKVISSTTAFENFLKLPSSGYREYYDGSIKEDNFGHFWTASTGENNYPWNMVFSDDGGFATWHNYGYRANGYPVRCVKR